MGAVLFDFCHQYGHSLALPMSLGPFLTKLASKNQSVGQRSQASAAVRLLNQAGPELGATPPPLQATPVRSGLSRLGQTLQARSAALPPPAPRAARPPPPGAQRRIPEPPRATRQDRPIAPVPQPDGGLGGGHSSAPARAAAGLKARWIAFRVALRWLWVASFHCQGYCCFARKNCRGPEGPMGAGGRMRNAFVMLTTVPGVQVEGGVRSEVDWIW